MSDKTVMEETIRYERMKMEDEQERIYYQVKKNKLTEEEQDGVLQLKYKELEQMREDFTAEEREILSLIDEQQGLMNSMRSERYGFLEDLRDEAERKNREMEGRLEDLSFQLSIMDDEI